MAKNSNNDKDSSGKDSANKKPTMAKKPRKLVTARKAAWKAPRKDGKSNASPGPRIGGLRMERIVLGCKIRKHGKLTGCAKAALDNLQDAFGATLGPEVVKPRTLKEWCRYLLEIDEDLGKAEEELLLVETALFDEGWDVANNRFFPEDEDDEDGGPGFASGDLGGGTGGAGAGAGGVTA